MLRSSMMQTVGVVEPGICFAGLRGSCVKTGMHSIFSWRSGSFLSTCIVWSSVGDRNARFREPTYFLRSNRNQFAKLSVKAGYAKGARVSSAKTMASVESGSSWVSSLRRDTDSTDESLAKSRTQSSWGSKTSSRTRDKSNWSWGTKMSETRFRDVEDKRDSNNYRRRGDGKDKISERMMNQREMRGGRSGNGAHESSVPRIIGEVVYGLGPVMAALSISRRQLNVLYVQEGMDLSSNNKKKKDKQGFEKVLAMAENSGISIREISKHDLNMIADNRPHQGLVLDASPLEMVKISELDPVVAEEDRKSLWVALDEVTDPQNLGAIVRSSYFFGAAGVVLCAKNSAPLSGVVSKASAGSLELMELRYCKNMMQFLVASAENGWRVLGGSVASKAVPLNEIAPGEPTILVLGSEGTGLRTLVERSCTQLVRIPGFIEAETTEFLEAEETTTNSFSREVGSFMAVESLNVSVAAGVLLHHLSQR